MSSREDTPEPGTSAASTSQAGPPAPQDNSRDDTACPECRDISTACSSSCRHCFCRLCLWDWSLGQAVCPRCQRPTRHPYPQHVALYHEVQERVYERKRRWRGRSAQQPRSCSGPWERRPRRSMRWPRDGRRESWHAPGSDSPRRRQWQLQRREDAPEEGQTLRFEWDVPASSQGHRSRRRPRRSWSQQERSRGRRRWSRGRERFRGWDRPSRREQDTQTGSPERSARQRHWRSWSADDRHAPGPQHDVPSERSETHQWEDADASGQQRTRRRQSRGRSHRRGQNSQAGSQGTVHHEHSTRQRRWRSWNADDRHTPRPQRDTPERRSERHQWEDRDSSRQQHAARSRTRGRSHRRRQNSQRASQGMPHNHTTRQRQWRSWNDDQE
nr:pre-mRNA-splicing factor 38B-like [Taeniopygia guttata]